LRIGLAIALPAVAVLIAVLAGNNLWYRDLADRPKAQDPLLAGPEPPPAPNASYDAAAATSVGPTKVRPVRADFPWVPRRPWCNAVPAHVAYAVPSERRCRDADHGRPSRRAIAALRLDAAL
jgi:hypothetical protein